MRLQNGTSETSWWCHRIYVLFWECCGSWCLIKHGRNCLKLLLWIKYLISSMFVERVRIHFTFSSPRKNEIFHHFFSNRRQSDGTAYRHDCRKKQRQQWRWSILGSPRFIICAYVPVSAWSLVPSPPQPQTTGTRKRRVSRHRSEWAWPPFLNPEKTQEQLCVKDVEYVYLFKKIVKFLKTKNKCKLLYRSVMLWSKLYVSCRSNVS